MNRFHRSHLILVLCTLSAALAAGCGGDSKQSGANGGGGGGGGGDCKDPDKALTAAARGHVDPLKLKTAAAEGDADRVTVEVCRTTEEDATAVVIVYGMRDDAIRDVRHEVRLIKVGGLWQVTSDQDSQRCQPGRGPQEFSSEICQ